MGHTFGLRQIGVCLIEYNPDTGASSPTRLWGNDDAILEIESDFNGNYIYFVRSNKEVGVYDVRQQSVSALTLPKPMLQITHIAAMNNGDMLFGTLGDGIITYHQGQFSPLPNQSSAPESIVSLAATVSSPLIIWTALSGPFYRWDAQKGWDEYNIDNTNDGIGTNVNDVALDNEDRVWVSHINGVSILVSGYKSSDIHDHTWVHCGGAPFPSGRTTKIFINHSDDVAWIAFRNGMARVEVSKAVTDDCSSWNPRVYDSSSLNWSDNIHLVVTSTANDHLITETAWLVDANANTVERFPWQSTPTPSPTPSP